MTAIGGGKIRFLGVSLGFLGCGSMLGFWEIVSVVW